MNTHTLVFFAWGLFWRAGVRSGGIIYMHEHYDVNAPLPNSCLTLYKVRKTQWGTVPPFSVIVMKTIASTYGVTSLCPALCCTLTCLMQFYFWNNPVKCAHLHFRTEETEARGSSNNLPAARGSQDRNAGVSSLPHLPPCLSHSLVL